MFGLAIALLSVIVPAHAAKVDPCSLLTKDEIKSIIKEAVTKTDSGASQVGTAFCHWYGAEGKLFQKGITLMVNTTNGKELFTNYKGLAKKPEPVAGVGDSAYTDKEDQTGITLYKGQTFLQVAPLYTQGDIKVDQCKALALKALARIK